MAPLFMAAAAMALQKKQEAKDKERARRDSYSQLMQQRAQSLGYPAMGVEAQRTARSINEDEGAGDDFMQMWLQQEEQKAAQRRSQQQM